MTAVSRVGMVAARGGSRPLHNMIPFAEKGEEETMAAQDQETKQPLTYDAVRGFIAEHEKVIADEQQEA